MQRILIVLGAVFLLLGLLWPWLAKSGLGRLPGDFVVRKGHYMIYVPLATSLIVSLALTLLLWLVRR